MTVANFNLLPSATGFEKPICSVENGFLEELELNFLKARFNANENIYSTRFFLEGKVSSDRDRKNTNQKVENFINGFTDSSKQVFFSEKLGETLATVLFKNLFVCFTPSYASNCLIVKITGEREEVEKFNKVLFENFDLFESKKVPFIHWCYFDDTGKMTKIKRELEVTNVPFTEMYPFLQSESLEDYYERFNSSSASILLLQGPPGTGKTTFIRGLLQHFKTQALLSYEEAILKSDTFLSSFIQDSNVNYLIFEDADAFLTSRESGNRTIHKFLNAGDGLISALNKKIIFTTNLQNLTDIDQALIRPGRCFDILQFQPLTKEEAIVVAQKQGIEIELPEQNFTIAEIFNTQKYTKKKEIRSVGFAV